MVAFSKVQRLAEKRTSQAIGDGSGEHSLE